MPHILELVRVYDDSGSVGVVGVLDQLDERGGITSDQELAEFAEEVRVD